MSNSTNANELMIKLEELQLTGVAKFDKNFITTLKNIEFDGNVIKIVVDLFYQTQAARIACENQIRAILQGADEGTNKSINILYWDLSNKKIQEKELFKILDALTDQHPVGRWMKKIVGVGPTISAGILAYLDIHRANYASNFISYAGLNDNNRPWLGREKGKKIVADILGDSPYITDDHLVQISAKAQWKVAVLDEACTIKDEDGTPEYYIDSKKFVKDACEFLNITAKEMKDIIGSTRTITKIKADELGEHFDMEDEIEDIFNNCAVTDKDGKLIPKRDKEKLIAQIAKIPYNANLKVLLFKLGECIVKVSGKDESLYGKLYKQFKADEIRKNENKEFADQAAKILETKSFNKSTDAYKAYSEGYLPDAHINRRAIRKVLKIFVSHVFEAMWWAEYGTIPPVPYVFGEMGHNDYIGPEVPYPKKEK